MKSLIFTTVLLVSGLSHAVDQQLYKQYGEYKIFYSAFNSSSIGFCFNSDRFIGWFYIAIGLRGFSDYGSLEIGWVLLKPHLAQKKIRVGRQRKQI